MAHMGSTVMTGSQAKMISKIKLTTMTRYPWRSQNFDHSSVISTTAHPFLLPVAYRSALNQPLLHLQRPSRPARSDRCLPGRVPRPPLPGRERCAVFSPAGTHQQWVERGEVMLVVVKSPFIILVWFKRTDLIYGLEGFGLCRTWEHLFKRSLP